MYFAVTESSEKEKRLMERYGIKCAQDAVYLYKGFRHENLKDALRYAEIDTQRDGKDALRGTN